MAASPSDITIRDDSLPDVFGPLISGYDVELASLLALQKWMHTYLAQVERLQGLAVNTWPRPRAYRITSEFERMPEDQLPAIIVRSGGTNAEPRPVGTGEGLMRGSWRVEFGALVSARSIIVDNCVPLALKLARLWALAIRGVVVQQQDDRGIIAFWDWIDERYDVIDADADRTICLGMVTVDVECHNVINRWAGPLDPLSPPEPPDPPILPPSWPLAEVVDVDQEKVPLDEPVKKERP